MADDRANYVVVTRRGRRGWTGVRAVYEGSRGFRLRFSKYTEYPRCWEGEGKQVIKFGESY